MGDIWTTYWRPLLPAWTALVSEIASSIEEMHCSDGGAWYRGVTNCEDGRQTKFSLIPSLFRVPDRAATNVERWQKEKGALEGKRSSADQYRRDLAKVDGRYQRLTELLLRRRADLDVTEVAQNLRSELDESLELGRTLQGHADEQDARRAEAEARWQEAKADKKRLAGKGASGLKRKIRDHLEEMQRAKRRREDLTRRSALLISHALEAKDALDRAMGPAGGSSIATDVARLRQLLAAVVEEHRREEAKIGSLYDSQLASVERRLRIRRLTYQLEADVYHEYACKMHGGHRPWSSWEILAEMRHHGVPTRLLDWTESAFSGLYFGLAEYRRLLEQTSSLGVPSAVEQYLATATNLPRPTLWVLNPYHISRDQTSRRRIWDVTKDETLDYYQAFLKEATWPWERALPIYSPWRHPRITAQRGFFTVHGRSREPLEDQFGGRDQRKRPLLMPIEVSPEAAAFGAFHLTTLAKIDDFGLMQDFDSFGRSLARQFL